MPRVTSIDIAKLAGVSQATVSRALRESPLVRPETRRHVQRIAKENNYSVDSAARSLRSGDNRTIAMLVREESGMDSAINPFFTSLLASIIRAAAGSGYDVLLSLQQLSEDWIADYETSNKAAGIILLGYGGYRDYIRRIALQGGAHVLTWGPVVAGQPGHFVGCDNRRGGYLATGHLLDLGHHRIAFIGDTSADCPEFVDRHRGYADALAEAHLHRSDALRVASPPSVQGGAAAVRHLLQQRCAFSAVFCASDLIALGAMRTLAQAQLHVPTKVSVVGFDDIPAAAHTTPALTTIRQDTTLAGTVIVATLLRLIAGEAANSRSLEPSLVVRESTAPAAAAATPRSAAV